MFAILYVLHWVMDVEHRDAKGFTCLLDA